MKLGYDLTIEQTQKLVMTPELIQAIEILQFNTQELDVYVSEQLLANPILERDTSHDDSEEAPEEDTRDDPLQEYLREKGYYDISYRQGGYAGEKNENNYEQYTSNEVTLPEHLMFQLQFVAKDRDQRRIGRYLIESLDENGYMTSSVPEIAMELHSSPREVEQVLEMIHTFDPPGVGARNLGECLLIQLEQIGRADDPYRLLLHDHLEDLAANRLGLIAKKLGVPVLRVQEMRDEIKTLEPKPGRQFASLSETRYIKPDVIVEETNGEYTVTLNESTVPHLMVSSYYEKVMNQSGQDENLVAYLKERLNSAVWLIKSIEQRKQTITNVVTSILKFQRNFFDHGERYLKTLTLKDVAEDLGIHESTVSRSISGKYLQCPRGVYELKYFFPAGVADEAGEGISSSSVKLFIRDLIDEEDPKAHYSDQAITNHLSEAGIDISRRTVAKYRDELGIPSSSRRKRYE